MGHGPVSELRSQTAGVALKSEVSRIPHNLLIKSKVRTGNKTIQILTSSSCIWLMDETPVLRMRVTYCETWAYEPKSNPKGPST